MKRPLALFCGTLIVVSLICSLIQIKEAATLCLSLFAVLLVAGIVRFKKSKRFLVISIAIMIAFLIFYLGYTLRYQKAIVYADNHRHSFYVSVTDKNTVKVSKVDDEIVIPFKMKVYFDNKVDVGDKLLLVGKVKILERTNELYDNALYSMSDNIYLQMSSPEMTVLNERDMFISSSEYLRNAIKNRLTSVLDTDTAGKITGIFLGDKSGIAIAQNNKYSAAGISHIFAVSGLHLTALVGILIVLLRLFYVKRKPMAFILAGAVVFFVWLVGFTASVQRAGIMVIVLCFSYVTNRRTDSLTSLCFAGAIICMTSPYAAADCGFLLSFSSVLAIITVSKYFCSFCLRCFEVVKLKNTVTEKISDILGLSVSVMFFTLPIIVICFGASTILSPLTNLLVLWALAPILILTILLLILPIKPIAILLTLLIRYVDKVVSLILKYDVLGNFLTQSVILILYVAMFVLFVMCIIEGRQFVNKAILSVCILVSVAAVTSFILNRFDGVTLIQTETYSGNCVLLIEDKRAMAILDGEFSFAPENTIYRMCDILSDYGIFELDKVVINSADKKFTDLLDSNIEIKEWYKNEDYTKSTVEFGENEISTDYVATYIKRGESSFLIMGKYDNKTTYEDVDADILIFANKCPDVDFMIERNIKLAISGRVKETITDRKYMNFLERFFQNNIYTVEECGTIEVRTTGNGEYDIKTERNNYAHK